MKEVERRGEDRRGGSEDTPHDTHECERETWPGRLTPPDSVGKPNDIVEAYTGNHVARKGDRTS